MCNNCLSSYGKSSIFYDDRPNLFKVQFPCGSCVDCSRRKKSDIRLRAYYEALDCFSHNGFALFDTLTYSDENLRWMSDIVPAPLEYPMLKDFKAFNRRDIQLFFKRLRRLLEKAGYDLNGKLRYLLTSEFGTSEYYKGRRCTHRPHYHLLFFVTFSIDPLVLSRFISKAWSLGRTDGVVFKGEQYVLYNRVLRGSSQNTHKLVNYVTKYVTKDQYNFPRLLKRAYYYFANTVGFRQKDYDNHLAWIKFKKNVLPFSLHSLNFGLFALKYEDPDYIDKFGAIRMKVNSKGVVASVPLSTYFKRKLYFTPTWFNGRLSWLPNSKYCQIKIKRFKQNVIDFRNRLFQFDNSLGLEKSTRIAEYQLLYRGLLVPRWTLNLSLDDFLKWRFSPREISFYTHQRTGYIRPVNGVRVWYNHSSGRSSVEIGNYISTTSSDRFRYSISYGLWTLEEFASKPPDGMVVIDDSTRSDWFGYDDILDNYNLELSYRSLSDQLLQCQRDEQKDRYKQLNLLI